MDREQFEQHAQRLYEDKLLPLFRAKQGGYQWGRTAYSNIERIAEFCGISFPCAASVLIAKHLGALANVESTADLDGPLSRVEDCIVYLLLLHAWFSEQRGEQLHAQFTEAPSDNAEMLAASLGRIMRREGLTWGGLNKEDEKEQEKHKLHIPRDMT